MSGFGKSTKKLVLTLFTHAECQLCVRAKANLAKVNEKIPFTIYEVDIKAPENKKWFDEYRYDVPVVHANGKFLLWHQVDVPRAIEKLQEITKESKQS
ncbi:Glutaredoxin-like protein C5orf63-like protein [Smittium mucronatum]|uniref:Glutaredoxin-like protein n=1 Tax=Smittium mucronatum TaxID=133383 RepID=A0A1R0GQW7_9FUNG|nr:Glutaredoxin-like protein C5orf63-like protein [Smittium mucronatum]